MSETEVSDTPIIVREDEVGVSEGRTIYARQTYTPPLDGSDDEFEQIDLTVARDLYCILTKKYFAYRCDTYANIRHGIVGFKITELMGPTLYKVINLRQYSDLTEDLVKRVAGDLLDRMGLPTDKFNMARYLEAKANKHLFEFGKVQ
jgi:hypothetical protein